MCVMCVGGQTANPIGAIVGTRIYLGEYFSQSPSPRLFTLKTNVVYEQGILQPPKFSGHPKIRGPVEGCPIICIHYRHWHNHGLLVQPCYCQSKSTSLAASRYLCTDREFTGFILARVDCVVRVKNENGQKFTRKN